MECFKLEISDMIITVFSESLGAIHAISSKKWGLNHCYYCHSQLWEATLQDNPSKQNFTLWSD